MKGHLGSVAVRGSGIKDLIFISFACYAQKLHQSLALFPHFQHRSC